MALNLLLRKTAHGQYCNAIRTNLAEQSTPNGVGQHMYREWLLGVCLKYSVPPVQHIRGLLHASGCLRLWLSGLDHW